jgi:hypothetical protein
MTMSLFLFQLIKVEPGSSVEANVEVLNATILQSDGTLDDARHGIREKGWDFPNMDFEEGVAVAKKVVADIKQGRAVIGHGSTTSGVLTHPWSVFLTPRD